MSSKTLVVSAHTGRSSRISGAVVESSIGSLQITQLFDLEASPGSPVHLPAGPFDRVIATLESETAAFRILDLPFRDRRRVSQAVGPALEEHVPFSLDDGVMAWDFAGQSATGSRVLAAMASSDRLVQMKAGLVHFGIDTAPHRLLWAPSVILTAYRRALGDDASFLAVDLGDGGATIARIEAGQVAGLRILAPCDDELLLRNTAWQLSTIAGDEQRVVVGGRYAVRLASALAARLPGHQLELLPETSPVQGLGAHDWRELTPLVGLLITASGDALAPLLDFEESAGSLFGLAALRELQTEAAPLLRWAAAAAVLAILAVGLDYVQLFNERRLLSDQAEKIYTKAMPAGSGGAGRKLKMEMRLRELSGKADAALAGAGGSPLAMLAALSRDVPKNLDVVVDAVEHSPPAAKVSGHAASFETVTKMQEALQKGGSFSRVEVTDVHAAVTGGGVEFLLELATSPPEGGA